MEQTIRHKVSGEVFVIKYQVIWMPPVWEKRGRQFKSCWRIG